MPLCHLAAGWSALGPSEWQTLYCTVLYNISKVLYPRLFPFPFPDLSIPLTRTAVSSEKEGVVNKKGTAIDQHGHKYVPPPRPATSC